MTIGATYAIILPGGVTMMDNDDVCVRGKIRFKKANEYDPPILVYGPDGMVSRADNDRACSDQKRDEQGAATSK